MPGKDDEEAAQRALMRNPQVREMLDKYYPKPAGVVPRMAKDLMGNEKTVYREGQEVYFDFLNGLRGEGRIRGLASQGLVDFWIVEPTLVQERDKTLSPAAWREQSDYPWSCVSVPHTLLRER